MHEKVASNFHFEMKQKFHRILLVNTNDVRN